jgi:hypothetical protein
VGWSPRRPVGVLRKTQLRPSDEGEIEVCGHCGAGGKLKRCGLCLSMMYCGVDCQRANYQTHKVVCVLLRAALDLQKWTETRAVYEVMCEGPALSSLPPDCLEPYKLCHVPSGSLLLDVTLAEGQAVPKVPFLRARLGCGTFQMAPFASPGRMFTEIIGTQGKTLLVSDGDCSVGSKKDPQPMLRTELVISGCDLSGVQTIRARNCYLELRDCLACPLSSIDAVVVLINVRINDAPHNSLALHASSNAVLVNSTLTGCGVDHHEEYDEDDWGELLLV